ncbi:MAG: non-canonical purine NTP diphosphatase [Bacteroidales bacterium]|nr:non-canonical purine NTP diphosphatase [Bacteroidales bacterium]MDD4671362.1 non-canonical purine NTP diphosphatase [Bacteroidales bacterium]MDY0348577.1 non-canonical purine NTP diphosphatase [Tenuifilaceae bacterium]
MRKIVFATNNKHKLFEVQQILGTKYSIKSLKDIGFTEDIPEDFQTLEENASQKAWHIYNKFKIDCFADDTGLEVNTLNGEPGVLSARYAGEQKSSHDNIMKLLEQLKDKPNRDAQFRTVIALIASGKEYRFEGIVRGSIIQHLKGTDGFGYDPVFLPKGYQETFAEMDIELKNRISHRGLAMSKLVDFLDR